MIRRILRAGLIVTVETALLLLLAAIWGVPGERRPAASAGAHEIPSFEQSIRRSDASGDITGRELEIRDSPNSNWRRL